MRRTHCAGCELDTVDARFSLRGTEPRRTDIAVVKVDDVTFDELNLQWPFPALARPGGRRSAGRGAAQIAYDIQFTEPTDPKEDSPSSTPSAAPTTSFSRPPRSTRQGKSAVLGGDEKSSRSAARAAVLGFRARSTASCPPRADDGAGQARQLRRRGRGVARAGGDHRGGHARRLGLDRLPGRPGHLPDLSFAEVVQGKVDPATFERQDGRGRRHRPRLQDVHTQPHGDERDVRARRSRRTRSTRWPVPAPARRDPGVVDVLLIAELAFAAALLNMLFRARARLRPGPGDCRGYAPVAQLASRSRPDDPGRLSRSSASRSPRSVPSAPSTSTPPSTASAPATPSPASSPSRWSGSCSEQDRGRARLGGTREEVTMMFSDIRGFTTFSEGSCAGRSGRDPQRATSGHDRRVLNHGGTLPPTSGDGIMAVFGAPVEQDDHADRALRAAREMLGPRLKRIQRADGEARRWRAVPDRASASTAAR